MGVKQNGSESNIVAAAIAVGVMALAATSLLLFAVVIWLAEVVGSLSVSLSVVGVVLALAAYITFKVVLHPALRQLRREYEVITQVSKLINDGYNWVSGVVALFRD